MGSATQLTSTLGRWSSRHPWRSLGVWVVAVVAAAGIGGAVGGVQLTPAQQMSGESARADRAVEKSFPQQTTQYVLLTSATLGVTDAPFRAAINDVAGRIGSTGLAVDVLSPLSGGVPGLVDKSGHAAMLEYRMTGGPEKTKNDVVTLDRAIASVGAAHPGIRMEQTGDASINRAYDTTIGRDFKRAEQLSIPITLLVLLFAFGALVAALLPLALAITAIVGAGGLLSLVSHLSPNSEVAGSLMLLIGLAVGVDYSMFYVKRQREERAAGKSTMAALDAAAATSGRSVFVSGLTVLVAMAGMLLAGNGIFTSVAVATMLVVAVAVVGSLTALPALLALLGDKVDRGRLPFLQSKKRMDQESRVWSAIVSKTLQRPALSAVLSVAALAALAFPALSMHTATPGATDMPHTAAALKTWDRIDTLFPGGPLPALVVVQAADVTAASVTRDIADLRQSALATGEMTAPITVTVNPQRNAAIVSIPLAGSGDNPASAHALGTLRNTLVPAAFGHADGVRVAVSGYTAHIQDFNSAMKARAPFVIGFVLLIALMVLLVAFRSLVIAVTSIVLNLLSVAAAYGVLVLTFQRHWAESLLDFTSTGSIAAWLPLFLFVILFGLSMDYHVFILSRIREEHDRGAGTRAAVKRGISSTAGVVTAAAVVMVFVFLTFVTLSQVSLKQIGLGLAVAVLLDATLVRGVLLPATLTLLGDRTWYLPRWLEWLPPVTSVDLLVPTATADVAALPREDVSSR